jgi:parallel beta-helix repeat protein/predicted outer membrane repeat protein
MWFSRLSSAAFALSVWSVVPAVAAVVNVPGDQPTIQAGIDAAQAGDTVLVADGTWSGPGNRNIRFYGKAITVVSGGGPGSCTIDCELSGRGVIFDGGEGPGSVLEGFTITGAFDTTGQGAGVICFDSSPTLTSNVVTGNQSSAAGGGIACHGASPVLEDCTVSENLAGWCGGGIACLGGSSPQITGCTISGNQASVDGGGIYCEAASNATIESCTVSGNLAAGYGGGLCAIESSPVVTGSDILENTVQGSLNAYGGGMYVRWGFSEISDSTFSRNTAYAQGSYHYPYGGGLCTEGGGLALTGCDFAGNLLQGSYDGYGGGLYCYNTSLGITGNRVTKNDIRTGRNQYGGGIYSRLCTGEISVNTISGNSLKPGSTSSYHGYGAGLYSYDDEITIEGNLIRLNRMECDYGNGGGMMCYYSTNSIIDNQIIDNIVDCYRGYGGGLNVDTSQVWVDGNVVSGNQLLTTSYAYGGGIYCDSYARSISWNTITGNRVDSNSSCSGGGLYVYYCSPVMIGNTISDNESICSGGGMGGGLFFDYSGGARPARIESSQIENNRITGGQTKGGGLYCEDATLYVVQSRIAGNSCTLDGGGIYFEDDGSFGPPELKNSELVGNIADHSGGGLYSVQNRTLLRNVLVSGNRAAVEGGGICAEALSVTGSTITLNDAPLGSGLYSATGEVTMRECIAWFNSGGEIYIQGGVPDVTYSDLRGGFIGEGNIDTDPLFVDGPSGGHYLSQVAAGQAEDSPCLDAGSASAEALGLGEKTTRTDEAADSGMADMGYHPYASDQCVFTDISVWPGQGTLPFSTKFQVTMRNGSDYPRAFAARIDLALGNGGVIGGWRRGFTNLLPGDAHYTSLLQPLPAFPSLVGENRCRMVVQDVTPAPYNQPPYPPSGQMDTDMVSIHAAAGTFNSDLVCSPLSGTLPFTGQNCIEARNVTDYNRRLAYRVRVYWGGGGSSYYHQQGYLDVGAHQLGTFCWEDLYDGDTYAGENEFILYTRDVTPAPYNQPPYPPSGHTETISVVVTGVEE